MKKLGLAFIFGAVSLVAQANEIHERKGIGYSQTNADACSDALDYLKKQSLLYYGAIMPLSDHSEIKPNVDKVPSADAGRPDDALVKIISKEEVARRDKKGNYVCVVAAKLSVDEGAVMKHNLAYKGQLPVWMVIPPSRPGRVSVIGKSQTLDGAIARTLHKYAEILAGEAEIIRHIENLLDGKTSPYIKETQLTPEVRLIWKRKYYMLGSKSAPFFIHSISEQTVFNKDGKIRHISEYREIESENGFMSNFEDESSAETKGRLGINKASAKLELLIDNLNQGGFNLRYQQMTFAGQKNWYVLLEADQPALKN